MLKKLNMISLLFIIMITNMLAANELNIYTARHYPIDEEIVQLFEQKTGIKVNVLQSNSSSLLQKLSSEGSNTVADLFMTADAISIYRAKQMGLLQKIKSPTLAKIIPDNLKDKDNTVFPVTKRARVIMYNVNTVNPNELSTYEDLTNPKWKGTILVRSSNNSYDQSLLSFLIATMGKEKATTWAIDMVKNFADTPKGKDRDQIRAISSGKGKLAIANTYYLGKMINSDKQEEKDFASNIRVFFPNQKTTGTHINISAAAVTAHAKNKNNAVMFIEFILSQEIQEKYMNNNFEYPVNKSIKWNDTLVSFGTFKENTKLLSTLSKYQEDAVKIFDIAEWR